jgi:hypothetical protein
VDLALQALQALDVLRLFGPKGVEHRLALARGVHAPLDADARDQVLKAETRADDADRAHDRMGIDDDLVGGAGEPVAAGRRHVLDEGDHLHALLVRQQADALGDQCRLHRRAARRVERQGYRLGAANVEGALEQRRHRFDRQAATAQHAARGDDSRQADDGNDGPAAKAVS